MFAGEITTQDELDANIKFQTLLSSDVDEGKPNKLYDQVYDAVPDASFIVGPEGKFARSGWISSTPLPTAPASSRRMTRASRISSAT
eukprot:16433330-Heterocapsa_arctica.AAC.1